MLFPILIIAVTETVDQSYFVDVLGSLLRRVIGRKKQTKTFYRKHGKRMRCEGYWPWVISGAVESTSGLAQSVAVGKSVNIPSPFPMSRWFVKKIKGKLVSLWCEGRYCFQEGKAKWRHERRAFSHGGGFVVLGKRVELKNRFPQNRLLCTMYR